MSKIIPFTYPVTGQEIRLVGSETAPLFHLADVCRALEHTNPTVAARMLDDDESVMIDMRDVFAGQHALNEVRAPVDGPNTTARFVTESGFYTLAFGSRAAGARAFRRWVTHEVLPTLRRTGRYEAPGAAPALDVAETESRLRLLGVARRAGGLNVEEVRSATRTLLDPWGLVHPDWQPLASVRTRADEVEAWMRRRYAVGDTLSERDAWQAMKGHVWAARTADVKAVLRHLVETGHLRAVPTETRIGRGRPPSPRFEVLPEPRHLAVVPGGNTDTPAPYAPTGGAS